MAEAPVAAMLGSKPARPRKPRKPKGSNRLASLPLELLLTALQILSELDLVSLLAVTLVDKSLRSLVLGPSCETAWLLAIEEIGLPELEAPLRPVELASLAVGRWCRVCGRSNARKVDYHLRARLCAKCFDEQIVYEGPDEPDPAFEGFFHGTKRYTPRNRTGRRWKHHRIFFLLSTLEATSDFLSRILEPQLDAYHAALEDDPLAELDDFLAFSALPDETQRALNERGDWVRKCFRDGDKLDQWDAARKKQANAERRRVREKAEAEDARAFLSAASGAPESS